MVILPMDIYFNKLEPEAQKALEDIIKTLGLSIVNGPQEPNPENMSCIGNCMPLNIPKPTTDVIGEGLLGVFKLIENVKSASYIKGETEIKIEIVIGVPPKIPSAVFEAKRSGGKI